MNRSGIKRRTTVSPSTSVSRRFGVASGFGVLGRFGGASKAPGRRIVWIAVLLSAAAHLIVALAVVLLPRVLRREARPQDQPTVELLMVEKKGAQPSPAGQPRDSKPAAAPRTPVSPKETETAKAEPPKAAVPPRTKAAVPPTRTPDDEPIRPTAEPMPPQLAKHTPEPANRLAAPPTPPPAPKAPVFNLAGTDSESNAIVLGGHVLPAMPDDKFRNRPPLYPAAAARRGEHGTVVVMIHVSENGLATGVDVVQSSGVEILDQAAVTAVGKWHFRPAMRDGRTIRSDMPFRFVFEP